MGRKRRTAGVVGALFALGGISTGVVLGAVQRATLSSQEAPAGTTVTLHVETTARIEGTRRGTLVIVPADAFDTSGSGPDCDEIAGAAAVGEMTWQTAVVQFGDGTYDGFVGDVTFIVPAVPPGSYHLGETIAVLGNRCHIFATLAVTDGQLPDTAMSPRGAGSP